MGNYTIVCALVPVIILALCQAESHSARLTAFGKTPNNQNGNSNQKKNTLSKYLFLYSLLAAQSINRPVLLMDKTKQGWIDYLWEIP